MTSDLHRATLAVPTLFCNWLTGSHCFDFPLKETQNLHWWMHSNLAAHEDALKVVSKELFKFCLEKVEMSDAFEVLFILPGPELWHEK